nr:unnamed protein product [uncultured bacterium]
MCVSPIKIKNPCRNPKLDSGITSRYTDTESLYIRVACGVCHECLSLKASQIIQRISAHCMENYAFMLTLTYKPDCTPRVVLDDTHILNCFDYSHFSRMVRRIRNDKLLPYPFTYCLVGEFGGKKHRPHYHALIFFDKKYFSRNSVIAKASLLNLQDVLYNVFKDNWSVNIGSQRKPIYLPLFEYHRRGKFCNFDLHFIDCFSDERANNAASVYVTKYLTKSSDYVRRLKAWLFLNYPRDIAFKAWKSLKPRVIMSVNLGVNRTAAHHIDECYTDTFESGKIIYTLPDGSKPPICKYFISKYIPKPARPKPDSLSDKSIVIPYNRTSDSITSSINRNDNKKPFRSSVLDEFL